MTSLLFGIDFDDTFSADPVFFHSFLDLIEKSGHKAIIVTNRKKPLFGDSSVMEGIDLQEVTKNRIPVVFANSSSKTKRKAAFDEGFKVDIWIDNNPYWIDCDKPYK